MSRSQHRFGQRYRKAFLYVVRALNQGFHWFVSASNLTCFPQQCPRLSVILDRQRGAWSEEEGRGRGGGMGRVVRKEGEGRGGGEGAYSSSLWIARHVFDHFGQKGR